MDKLQRLINSCNYVVFFGGAGVSTESGLKDFRSRDGLYNEKNDVPPEMILSHGYFEKHTDEFFEFYKNKMIDLDILPNKAHKKLAEMEKTGKLKAVITQNIDGLHQAAGSVNVLELHGSVHRNYCTKCNKFYDAAYMKNAKGVPKCTCGGVIKPDVVLYDEALDDETVTKAVEHISKADLLIIAGTSLMVYPAAGLLRYFHGQYLALINKEETSVDRLANYVSHEKVGEVLGRMSVNVEIKNEFIEMKFTSKGAQCESLKFKGEEQLWQDNGRLIWEDHSPVLFPICSSLRDGKYHYEGKWYEMPQHGFSKGTIFDVEELSSDKVVFCLKENEETLEKYPFLFSFRVEYKLSDNKVITTYSVENRDGKILPASFGSHEAYNLPDGIENYEIVFPEDDFLMHQVMDGRLVNGETKKIELINKTLPLTRGVFGTDSYVIKDHKSRSVTLRRKDGGREIKIDFPGIDYLVLWHKEDADYVCIEPWCSFIDRTDSDGDITKREGIILVKPGETVEKTHTITF